MVYNIDHRITLSHVINYETLSDTKNNNDW